MRTSRGCGLRGRLIVCGVVPAIAVLTDTGSRAATGQATTGPAFEASLRIDEFGTTPGTPTKSGFVFHNGAYVEPPYVVTRKGLGILVNWNLVDAPEKWPEGVHPTAPDLLRRAERRRQQYETDLKAGGAYFFFDNSENIRLDEYGAAYHALPRAVRLLRSSRPLEDKLAELRAMGWHFHVGPEALATLVRDFRAPPQLEERIAESAQRLLRVEEFGVSAGQPIDAGFVFVDGKYVSAPYTVSRKGLGLFINDSLLVAHLSRPIEAAETRPSIADTDPDVPSTIGRKTSRFDPDILEYVQRKYTHLKKQRPEDKDSALLVASYEGLPCVDEAREDTERPDSIVVKWADGATDRICLGVPGGGRQPVDRDRNSLLARLERQRRGYEERLVKGDYYLFFSRGGQITGGAAAAAKVLPRIVTILRSPQPVDAKVAAIREAGLVSAGQDTLRALVTEFTASPQLEERLRALPAAEPPAGTTTRPAR